MKKAVYFTLGLILLSVLTNAANGDNSDKQQTTKLLILPTKAPSSGKKCFDESTKVLNIGIGFGYSYYNYAKGPGVTTRNLPTISVSYEQPWTKRFGPGLMGVGGYLGFKSSTWKYENNYAGGSENYKDNYTNIIIASRAMYHWDGLNSDKAEVYGGFILGVRLESYKYTKEYTGTAANLYGTNVSESSFSVGLAYSLVAGARYYFKPNFGVYSELSYGISFLTVGVSLKI